MRSGIIRTTIVLLPLAVLLSVGLNTLDTSNADTQGSEIVQKDAVRRWREIAAVQWSGDPASVDKMISALDDPDAKVRCTAARALGFAGDKRAVQPLISRLKDTDSVVIVTAAEALGRLGDPRAAVPMTEVLLCENNHVNKEYLGGQIAKLGKPAVEPLLEVLHSQDRYARRYAAKSLERIAGVRDLPIADQMANDQDSEIRRSAIRCFRKAHASRAIPILKRLVDDADSSVRLEAAEALADFKTPEIAAYLIANQKKTNDSNRPIYPFVIGRMGDAAIGPLRAAIKDPALTGFAIDALKDIKSPAAANIILGFIRSQKDPWPCSESVSRAFSEMGKAGLDSALEALKIPRLRVIALNSGVGGDRRAVPFLIAILNDKHSELRPEAAAALGHAGDRRAIRALIASLSDKSVRNEAARALGELGVREAVPSLTKLLRVKDASTRKAAANALGAIGDSRAVAPLTAAFNDKNPSVKLAVVSSLWQLGDPHAVDLSAKLIHFAGPMPKDDYGDPDYEEGDLSSPSRIRELAMFGPVMGRNTAFVKYLNSLVQNREKDVWMLACRQLEYCGDTSSISVALPLLKDPDPEIRLAGAKVIASVTGAFPPTELTSLDNAGELAVPIAIAMANPADPAAAQSLVDILAKYDPQFPNGRHDAYFALHALSVLKDKRAVDPTIAILEKTRNSDDSELRAEAAFALGEIGDARAVPVLIAALREWDPWLSEHTPPFLPGIAASALGKIRDPQAVEPLLSMLNDDDRSMRLSAVHALGLIGGTGVGDALRPLLKDSDRTVRANAAQALVRLGDKSTLAILVGMVPSDPDPCAVDLLVELTDPEVLTALETLVSRGDASVNAGVLRAIERNKDSHKNVVLVRIIACSPNSWIRREAAETLARMTGQSFGVNVDLWNAWLKSHGDR